MESKSVLNYLLSLFLLLTIVIYYLGENGKVNNFPTYILGLLALYATIVHSEVRQFFIRSRVLQLSALLLCYFAISAFWSIKLDWVGIGKAIGNVPLLLAFLLSIIICCRSMKMFLPVFTRLLVLAACVSAIYSIYLYHTYHLLPFIEDRIFAMGRLGSPVMSAFSYGVASLFTMHLLLSSTDRIRLWGWLLVELILLYAIFKTGTMAVWVGLVPAWIILLSIQFKFRPEQVAAWLLLALVMSIISVTSLFYFDPEIFKAIFPRAGSYRPEIWSTAISLTIDHNLLLGFGHLDSGNLTHGQESFHHAHSIYLASFYYGGIVGFLLLLGLISKCFGVVANLPSHTNQIQVGSDWNPSPTAGSPIAHASYRELATICLTSLVFGCVVFVFDGDRLLEKVGLIWIVFWLPVGLAAVIEIENTRLDTDL